MTGLTDEQIAQLHAELLNLRESLESELRQTAGNIRPVSLDEPIGRSRMDPLQQPSMSSAQRTRMMGRLRRVMAALSRMNEGDYGECLRCGEWIEYGRLRIRPEATLCRECQDEENGPSGEHATE